MADNLRHAQYRDDGTQIDDPQKVVDDESGSSAVPGGSNAQIQFNDAESFAGATGLLWDKTTNVLTIAGGMQTANNSQLITQTWNNAAVTFTGWRLNVTDTASAAASLLLDLQVGGASRASVTKAGVLTVRGAGGSAGMAGDASYRGAFLRYEGSDCLIYSTTRLTVRAGAGIGWSSSGSFPELDPDTGLHRNAAGVVEVNNGTAGQYRDLRLRNVIQTPPASITPANNGELVVEATSNTSLTLKLRGTDGTVRSVVLTLA